MEPLMNLIAYSPQIIGASCAVVLLIMAFILLGIARQRARVRSEELRALFGPEYDVAVRQYGSRRKAEAILSGRLRRMHGTKLRELSSLDRDQFSRQWESIQGRFVDSPRGAVIEADDMIDSILRTRGYTGRTFEQRAADLSVSHARLVDSYRLANSIVARAGKNDVTTEELRTAMLLYRALLEALLSTGAIATVDSKAA